MKDKELELLTDWRFTKVYANGKKPYPGGWQVNHLSLCDIPQTDNVGVVLGVPSNGVMALDFDGPTSWVWFQTNIGCNLPTTVSWASGKDARCQMAFKIAPEYWEFIRTIKITTKPGDPSIGLKPEQMEFRWNGAQSVLPPSIHPERKDGYNYSWVVSPSESVVAELPDAVLAWLLSQAMPKAATTVRVQGDINTIRTTEFEQLEAVLLQLKQMHPVLDYDTWLRISFATAHEIGDGAAALLLSTVWPEEEPGEYLAHLRGRDTTRSPTMGTLVYMVKEAQGANKRQVINNNKF